MNNAQLTAIRNMAEQMTSNTYKIYHTAAHIVLQDGLTLEQAEQTIARLGSDNLIICH